MIGSIRRECTDHIIPLGERHLRRVLSAYVAYYNAARTHQALAGNSPEPRWVDDGDGEVVGVPVLNGLHHRYKARPERRDSPRSQRWIRGSRCVRPEASRPADARVAA